MIGIAKVDDFDFTFENCFLDDQHFEFGELTLPTLLGKLHGHTTGEKKIPAAFAQAVDRLRDCG